MNTGEEPNEDLVRILEQKESTKDTLIGNLEKELIAERDKRKEERFAWVCIVGAIVNILLLGPMENPVTPIIFFILELFALLIFARHSGIEFISVLIDRLISSVTKRIENGD